MNLVYHIFSKLKIWLENPYNKIFVLLLVIGVFLRFYRLEGFVTFLGDQGRDAIVLKRMITCEHFPAIGAPSSVGQVFLGPFYYYFIAPWLLLSGFHPIGPAIGVAFFSSLFLVAAYLIISEFFDKKVALVTVCLLTFSEALITLSRYSWNPNLLPLAVLLLFYLLIKAIRNNDKRQFFLAGALFSITIQLHYVALALALPIGILLMRFLYKSKKPLTLSRPLKSIGVMALSFSILTSPLLIFDLRHDFLNTTNLIALFTSSGSVGSSGLMAIFPTFTTLTSFVLGYEVSPVLAVAVLLFMGAALFLARKEAKPIGLVMFFFLTTLLVTSLYTGRKIPHYFGALYLFYYLILGYILTRYFWNKKLGIILVVFLTGFIMLQFPRYSFLLNNPNNQIQKAMAIARIIRQNTEADQYQVTSLPYQYSDSTYRYFLEIWGNRPVEKDSIDRSNELFVVCEGECKPIGDPQWDIAFFAPNRVLGTWDTGDVRIYKLIR